MNAVSPAWPPPFTSPFAHHTLPPPTRRPSLPCLLLLLVQLTTFFGTAIGGTCWATMVRNGSGRCKEIYLETSTREECCDAGRNSMARAWSAEDLDSGTLFFWRILGGGVPCAPCQNTCEGVECGADKACVVRKGAPKCICSSRCKELGNKARGAGARGAVCGSDGRSYRNVCRLRKRACRHKSNSLQVAYNGICQSSCDKINCPSGKHCLLDQNLTPHCVNCMKKCPIFVPKRRQVCGSDGLTYPSACHLREKACRKGKAVPIAYKGPCQEKATCMSVVCRERQQCLKEMGTGAPRCVSCGESCRPRHMHGPICGTNNSTYHTWCHMMQDACRTGYVIDTLHNGKCRPRAKMGTT